MVNLFMKLNYKDLLTSVKVHVAGSAIAFSWLSYKITFFMVVTEQNEDISTDTKSWRASTNFKKDVLYLRR